MLHGTGCYLPRAGAPRSGGGSTLIRDQSNGRQHTLGGLCLLANSNNDPSPGPGP